MEGRGVMKRSVRGKRLGASVFALMVAERLALCHTSEVAHAVAEEEAERVSRRHYLEHNTGIDGRPYDDG